MVNEKKKTVLVIGGSGFLGSHTADHLSSLGFHVRILDRTKSSYLTSEQEMIIGDVTDLDLLSKAMKGCDYVYHFAGIADLEEAKEKPVETCRVNVLGTVQVLEAARREKIERFVFASTVYVYSKSGGFYRASKQACENFIEQYNEYYGLPYTILRYGSLYGRRAGPENGINRLIHSALEQGEIVYNGDPDAVREYIHVSDAARLSVDILGEKYKNQRIMLTGQNRIRVLDLMKMIAEMLPNQPELKFGQKILEAHYVMTPYNYNPKLAHKLTSNDHIELGQGLLDCIAETYENRGHS